MQHLKCHSKGVNSLLASDWTTAHWPNSRTAIIFKESHSCSNMHHHAKYFYVLGTRCPEPTHTHTTHRKLCTKSAYSKPSWCHWHTMKVWLTSGFWMRLTNCAGETVQLLCCRKRLWSLNLFADVLYLHLFTKAGVEGRMSSIVQPFTT